jgi:hypothetical protein
MLLIAPQLAAPPARIAMGGDPPTEQRIVLVDPTAFVRCCGLLVFGYHLVDACRRRAFGTRKKLSKATHF